MSLKYCADFVYFNDKDRFTSLMFLKSFEREKIFPLFAFYLEICKIPWIIKEEGLAEIKMMWWYEKIAESNLNQKKTDHPILDPLLKVIKENKLPIEKFLKIINTRKFDIYKKPHKNFSDQIKYFYNSSGTIMDLTYLCLVKNDVSNINRCAHNFGFLQGVGNLVSNLPILINSGRSVIFYETDLKNGFIDLVKFSLNVYEKNIVILSLLPKSSIKYFLPAAISVEILRNAIKNPESFISNGFKMSTFKKRILLFKSFYLNKI